MRRIKTVLAIFNAENDALRQNCNGICRYANKVRWHVEMLLAGDVAGHLSEILDFWQPIGVLIDATRNPDLAREISLRAPTCAVTRRPMPCERSSPRRPASHFAPGRSGIKRRRVFLNY